MVLVEPYLAGTSSRLVAEALRDVPHRALHLGVQRTETRHYGSPGTTRVRTASTRPACAARSGASWASLSCGIGLGLSPPTAGGASAARVRIVHGGVPIVDSTRCWRVLETSHPPVYYVPRADVPPRAAARRAAVRTAS